MRGDSGFWLWFWFVLQSFLVLLRGRRSGGVSVGKERVSCSLVGLAAWYFLDSPIVCYFCLLFLGVTVVGAVVSGALPWSRGGRQLAGCLFHSSGL